MTTDYHEDVISAYASYMAVRMEYSVYVMNATVLEEARQDELMDDIEAARAVWRTALAAEDASMSEEVDRMFPAHE